MLAREAAAEPERSVAPGVMSAGLQTVWRGRRSREMRVGGQDVLGAGWKRGVDHPKLHDSTRTPGFWVAGRVSYPLCDKGLLFSPMPSQDRSSPVSFLAK